MNETHGPHANLVTIDEAAYLESFQEAQRTVDALEALGGVPLDPNSGQPEEPEITEDSPLQALGIVNRRSARRAGLRNAKRQGAMASSLKTKRR